MSATNVKTTVAQREVERQAVNDQITEFFSNGGVIEQVPGTGVKGKELDFNHNYPESKR